MKKLKRLEIRISEEDLKVLHTAIANNPFSYTVSEYVRTAIFRMIASAEKCTDTKVIERLPKQ